MKTIIVKLRDTKTGYARFETWDKVTSININPCYKAPDGHFYTIGAIGFFNVSHLVKF